MTDDINITNNEQQMHFEAKASNGETAYIEYRWLNHQLVLMHTSVPESMEGKGVASALAEFALQYAAENHLKVIVYCIFVNQYLARHPEYNYLLVKK